MTRPSPSRLAAAVAGLLFAALLSGAAAAPPPPDRARAELERRFTASVRPFLQTYCFSCHSGDKPQAALDLTHFTDVSAALKDFGHLSLVLGRLDAGDMPPKNARQPAATARAAVSTWIRDLRRFEATRNAGDPGPVTARRLSNAEYDYTIHDLTGQDLRPTREFPLDPANQEGFDNSSESLTLSPALLRKYMQAARGVAEHLVLKPEGFDFAPHLVLADTDRDKYSILRIVDFYRRQPTDLADYFRAAWLYRHRAALGTPQTTLEALAGRLRVSAAYLEQVWGILTLPGQAVGPIAALQARWNALPPPGRANAHEVRAGCEGLRDFVTTLRKKVAWRFDNLRLPGFSPGGQCFAMWKNRQYAAHRRRLNPDALQVGGIPRSRTITPSRPNGGMTQDPPRVVTDPVDPDLFVPADAAARAPYLAAFERFCDVFPDAFYIAERGRVFIDDPNDRGRLLSAGLHNAMGYFRDDTPLMELILDDAGRRELDRLWLEFDFIAFVPERMHREFIFYERAESRTIREAEFDFARSEDKDITSDAKLQRLAAVYLAKARRSRDESGGSPEAIPAIEEHFRLTAARLRAIERVRAAAEPSHLAAMIDFARRAYRRPLTAAERGDLEAFYRSLRQSDGLTHEEAIRDCVVRVLMSPHFLFVGVGGAGTAAPGPAGPATGQTPLTGYELASRLSYFLWSSLPDEELLARAAAGDLQRPEVLTAQAKRLLRHPRARRLAVEFGGNWLDFRRFETHNAVDRTRFPAFDDALRQAMFEEPVRFLQDIFQQDRSVLDCLHGRHTFVNAPLARHYGMDGVRPAAGEWVRVDEADRHGRGGLLPMAVFLTANSPGLRTSPVKRGYWVVRRVLGEHIPPPPPTVPELPADEGMLGDLTLRQALEKHRENPACGGCHARFDSFGLVFEKYGPTGERRTRDLGGKPVDTRAPFPGGTERDGLAGLQAYLRAGRQADFLDTLSRKLLSYALGRSLQPSDDALLAQMRRRLTAGGHRFGLLVEEIAASRQFRYRRG
jgi:hypothetical protein